MSVHSRTRPQDEPVVVRLVGELDAGDSGFGDEVLGAVRDGAGRVIVDMLNVSFIDSSVIRVLVLAHRGTAAAGGWLRVVYTHHLVRRVIDMCGLSDMLPQYPTIEAARRGAVSAPPVSESSGSERGHQHP